MSYRSSYIPISGTFNKPHDINNSLTFTYNLNDIQYRPDGSGRDFYIIHNNGGIQTHESPKLSILSDLKRSGALSPIRDLPKGLRGEIARRIRYKPDGSGRDSYVKDTDGGLTFPGNPCDPRELFKRTVRKYEKLESYNKTRSYHLST